LRRADRPKLIEPTRGVVASDKPTVVRLTNQLPVLVQETPNVPSTAVVVLAKVGSRYESDKQAGIAHFLEHLAFKGTTKRPMTMDIAAEVDRVGGEFNAFTSKEYTGFYIKTATQDAELAFDL